MPILDQLNAQLDRLAAFDPGPYPVLSVYLDLRPNQNGRDRFEPFLEKELASRVATYAAAAPERSSLDRDAARVRAYVADVDASLNGLAMFACSGADLFEAVPLAAPVGDHRLFISDLPHLYPLAKVIDEYPKYLALLADTHSARIFVFAANAVEKTDLIEGVKTKRHKMGGWSQARYQRHMENYHLHHAKEVVDAVARIVREERIDQIVISGDEVIVPLLREQFPKDVAERIVDVVKLEMRANERDVLETTIAALREKDVESDRERVDQVVGAYRAGGLACVGVEATRRAFELGQVDELLIPASADVIRGVKGKAGDTQPERTAQERAADELIVLARQTSAKIRFIEDPALLAPVGGVAASLRFKI
jgi:peptide chain release factor subunit 1